MKTGREIVQARIGRDEFEEANAAGFSDDVLRKYGIDPGREFTYWQEPGSHYFVFEQEAPA